MTRPAKINCVEAKATFHFIALDKKQCLHLSMSTAFLDGFLPLLGKLTTKFMKFTSPHMYMVNTTKYNIIYVPSMGATSVLIETTAGSSPLTNTFM